MGRGDDERELHGRSCREGMIKGKREEVRRGFILWGEKNAEKSNLTDF